MTTASVFDIYRERIETPDGADLTDIKLHVAEDGALRFDGVYSGPAAEKFWGDWDHEFWINVDAAHAPAVIALILRDAFNRDGRLTWSELQNLLSSAAIPFEQGSWT